MYSRNPKCKKVWTHPGEPSTSTTKPNRYELQAMLCFWGNQEGVLYELLKRGEAINTERKRQQNIDWHGAFGEKRPEY